VVKCLWVYCHVVVFIVVLQDGLHPQGEPRCAGVISVACNMLTQDVPQQVAEIPETIVRNDTAKWERAAHRLNGSQIPFVAAGAVTDTQTLESMGHTQDLSNAFQECLHVQSKNGFVITDC
jgi:hypothetical protein